MPKRNAVQVERQSGTGIEYAYMNMKILNTLIPSLLLVLHIDREFIKCFTFVSL